MHVGSMSRISLSALVAMSIDSLFTRLAVLSNSYELFKFDQSRLFVALDISAIDYKWIDLHSVELLLAYILVCWSRSKAGLLALGIRRFGGLSAGRWMSMRQCCRRSVLGRLSSSRVSCVNHSGCIIF